jgi:hypothetical protein
MRFPSFRTAFRIVFAALAAASLGAAIFACSTSTESAGTSGGPTDGGLSRDADPVDVFDGSTGVDSGIAPPPPLSCTKYCELVQDHCKGEHAQYASKEECLAFCAHIPPGDPNQMKETPGMYCRQAYAGNPSLTDPEKYCAAAGPFGGGICGDRCTAFCQVTFSACAPDGSAGPYASVPKCKTECVEYTFKDAGVEGGGEGLDGPKTGDTLNCRLYHLRQAVTDAGSCEDLGPDAGDCR